MSSSCPGKNSHVRIRHPKRVRNVFLLWFFVVPELAFERGFFRFRGCRKAGCSFGQNGHEMFQRFRTPSHGTAAQPRRKNMTYMGLRGSSVRGFRICVVYMDCVKVVQQIPRCFCISFLSMQADAFHCLCIPLSVSGYLCLR